MTARTQTTSTLGIVSCDQVRCNQVVVSGPTGDTAVTKAEKLGWTTWRFGATGSDWHYCPAHTPSLADEPGLHRVLPEVETAAVAS